jgi:ribosomal protein S18 acetylase RimI-like enzyme
VSGAGGEGRRRAGLEIRHASPEDAQLLADLSASTFRETYSANNDPDEVERHIASNFSVPQIRVQIEDPASSVLLASVGGEPLGYALLAIGTAPACVHGPSPIELVRIYLARQIIGQGHGSALLRASLGEGERLGRETIWLGVWEENTRACAFYERWGFVRVGTYEFLFGGKSYDDLVMARPIRSDAATTGVEPRGGRR